LFEEIIVRHRVSSNSVKLLEKKTKRQRMLCFISRKNLFSENKFIYQRVQITADVATCQQWMINSQRVLFRLPFLIREIAAAVFNTLNDLIITPAIFTGGIF
jgi:hypothetical protein